MNITIQTAETVFRRLIKVPLPDEILRIRGWLTPEDTAMVLAKLIMDGEFVRVDGITYPVELLN